MSEARHLDGGIDAWRKSGHQVRSV